jgi:hypothetical protein
VIRETNMEINLKTNRLLRLKSYQIFVGTLLVLLTGCSNVEMEQAFKGEFQAGKSNKIIGEYCQSCHIHMSFDPAEHVSKVRSLYKSRVFRKARECRSCHYVEKNWMHNQHKRKTRMPDDANRGKFRKFEKKEMSRRRKS